MYVPLHLPLYCFPLQLYAIFLNLTKLLCYYYQQVQIWIRRAGPNYQEGLAKMRETQQSTGLPIHIYGPETHITAVVPLALGVAKIEDFPEFDDERHLLKKSKLVLSRGSSAALNDLVMEDSDEMKKKRSASIMEQADNSIENFTAGTRCFIYGLQQRAVQGMLDFDYMCKRKKPSVAAMIFPFSGNHYVKFYWGTEEMLIPGKQ